MTLSSLVKIMFKRNNSSHRLTIVDDVDKLLRNIEGFVKDLHRDRYNYILLFLDAPENLSNLIQHVDYLIISLWMRFKLAKINKILNMEIDQNIYLNLTPKSFTWLMIKV